MHSLFATRLCAPIALAARHAACLLLFLVCLTPTQLTQAAQSTPLGLVSLLEGDAVLLRDNAKFALVEGASLQRDDIIELGGKKGFMLLEFTDGSSVALGPATSVQLAPRLSAERTKIEARLYLLQGWLKVSAAKGSSWALSSSSFDLTGLTQDAVIFSQGNSGQIFAEAGDLNLRPLLPAGTAAVKLTSGGFLTWSGSGKPELAQRAPAGFLQNIPKAFQDKLPSRAAFFKGKDIKPNRLGEVSYADAQAWLNAEPAVRKANLNRWKALARSPEFRKGLLADIKSHPEWESILFAPQAASAPQKSAGPEAAAKY